MRSLRGQMMRIALDQRWLLMISWFLPALLCWHCGRCVRLLAARLRTVQLGQMWLQHQMQMQEHTWLRLLQAFLQRGAPVACATGSASTLTILIYSRELTQPLLFRSCDEKHVTLYMRDAAVPLAACAASRQCRHRGF